MSPDECRLITYSAQYWRGTHSEEMTHRMHSRNSASTRAIPLRVQLRNLLKQAFMPAQFGTAKGGMEPDAPLTGAKLAEARDIWLTARDRELTGMIELMIGREHASRLLGYDPQNGHASAAMIEEHLEEIIALVPVPDKDGKMPDLTDSSVLNVAKQLAGRLIEPHMWHTMVVTVSESQIQNYLNLRDHPAAQGEITTNARNVRAAIAASTPKRLDYGEWHTPLVAEGEFESVEDRIMVSAARCAAVSYNRQTADVPYQKLVNRYHDLVSGGHMSPLEHQARPFSPDEWSWRRNLIALAGETSPSSVTPLAVRQLQKSLELDGNFQGWHQHRKDIEGEDVFVQERG